ncbi:hypothetical protein RB653_003787 [Dictyostelium firmibasis]|uniref:DNA repair protein RAD50 n=1 Tax=Dictyostelium firmibasis TaxID=79012 RepID=A0AAN7TYC2_9MYCE
MTSIEKLLVQGIRSFDPREASVIDFYSPLTLIVGQNGAGKTTIIECLKYTCTGEMPPNCSSGQAFIHDTKIAGESEVKAQIKLRFKNPIGKPIVASRSLSLIQKSNKKQEYKQIDASLQSYTSDGQKVSKSFRCSDMDKEIPDLMGVAKPILKHVIFCHQEDSNWPLSESSKLKLKFDEIFSAVKYTKALKSLKDKRKELTALVKEFKLRLETISANIEHCNRIRKDLIKSEEFYSNGNKNLEEIKITMLEKQKTLSTIKNAELKLQEVKNEVTILNARKLEMERVKNQLFNSLTEVYQNETDEELVFMQSEFNRECETMATAEKELLENSELLQSQKEIINNQIKGNISHIGRLQSTISQQESISTDRDKQIKELVTRYKMTEFIQLSLPYEKETVIKFVNEITQKFDTLSSGISNYSKTNKLKLNSIQMKINQKRVDSNQFTLSSNEKKSTIALNFKKIESLDHEVQQHTISIGEIDSLETSIRAGELELSALQSDANLQEIQQSLDNLTAEKLEIEKDIQTLQSSLKLLNLQASSRTRLNIKRNEIQQSKQQINLKLTDEIIKSINNIFPSEFKSSSGGDDHGRYDIINRVDPISSLVGNEISTFTIQLNKLKQQFQSLQVKKNQIDAQLTSSIEPQLKKKQQELDIYQRLIMNSTDLLEHSDNIDTITVASFENKINKMKQSLEKQEKSFIVLESEDILYKEYIEKANQDKECSLCKNEMDGSELKSFVHTLESHCNDIPNQLKQLRMEIGEAKKHLDALNKILPTVVKREEIIEKSIPELKETQQNLIQQQLESNEMVLKQQKQIESIESQLGQCQQISLVFQFIDGIKQSIQSIEREIEKEEQEIKKQSSDLRTIEEVDKDLEVQQQQLKIIEKEISNFTIKQKNDQTKIFEKEKQLILMKNQLSTIKSASGIIDHLRDTKKELQSNCQILQLEIEQLQQSIDLSNEEAQQLEKEFQQLEVEVEKKMDTYSKEKNTFSVRLDSINSLQSKIVDSSELSDQLKDFQNKNQDLETNLQTLNQDYLIGQQHISTIQQNLSSKDVTKRAISDNISYRQHKNNIEQIIKQITRKNELVKEMMQSQLEIDSNKLDQEINSLKSKFDQITGQTAVLQSQINSNRQELSKPTFKNIEDINKDLLIKLQTTETVGKDLDKYYKALDKSLMKYHTLKMDEINRSIKEIWQTTYKGSDIDTIEIRSEETGTANKTINYRVVMIKGDVELDMRGRCSAGQKVLACLVIRLALAENFCSNCGILALDEPTSHLDRANIESFANSLLNIIESRKSQKGFQLIIITHDEEFVQYLSRGNYCDYYWRVTKNANQHSHLERKEIAEL